jgi:hypothetical protein
MKMFDETFVPSDEKYNKPEDFQTAEQYAMYRVSLQHKYRADYKIPREKLIPIIDVIRALPRDEAQNLLGIYGYVRDGDYGYGSWWDGYQYWVDAGTDD